MRRLRWLLPSLLLLAGCGGPPPAPPAASLLRASFPRGGVAEMILVEARDPLPLRTAELVAPDGTATRATAIEAARAPQLNGGQQTLKSPWLNSRFDEHPVALPNVADATYRSETQVLLIVSSADIPLPDPVVYRRDWANYRIRLGFAGGGGQIDTREIAAPAPPAGDRPPGT